jgi:hypothetical protein
MTGVHAPCCPRCCPWKLGVASRLYPDVPLLGGDLRFVERTTHPIRVSQDASSLAARRRTSRPLHAVSGWDKAVWVPRELPCEVTLSAGANIQGASVVTAFG